MALWLLSLVLISCVSAQRSYCSAGPLLLYDTNLENVVLVGDNSTISASNPCPGQPGVIDFTSLSANLSPGNNYTLSLLVATCGGQYSAISSAWIDYDQNGVYNAWEQIVPVTTGYGALLLPFTVPFSTVSNDVLPGPTNLRVQTQESAASSMDPCANFAYGSTLDFTVVINPSQQYCVSGPTALNDSSLGPISLQGYSNSLDDQSACESKTIGPQNLTDLYADLVIGDGYTIFFNVILCNTSTVFQTVTTGWIDYNQNGQFEGWEQIITPSRNFGAQNASFKVPISTSTEQVKTGFTRFRFQTQETAFSGIDPCAKFVYGGTKDFSVYILPTVNGNWSQWSTCTNPCGGVRTRQCTNPPPSQEGQYCVGDSTETCNDCSSSSSGTNGGAVAAGILIPLIVIGAAVAFYYYRKRASALKDDPLVGDGATSGAVSYDDA